MEAPVQPAASVLDAIRGALQDVHDPEIPVLSIVDLGLVEDVRVRGCEDATAGQQYEVEIDLLPTFTGCPALGMIQDAVVRAVGALPDVASVRVRMLLSPAWSTDRMTDRGREQLKAFGIAPAAPRAAKPAVNVACPYCGATDTVLESAFGPTRCRTIYYCRACKNPFEKFKEI